jgi:hypothetical protein
MVFLLLLQTNKNNQIMQVTRINNIVVSNNKIKNRGSYTMPVAEMLIDSAAGFEFLSMLDGYSGYNQIFIAEEDVSKTTFRCSGALGTYEWVVMPF